MEKPMTDYTQILYDVADNIATITINRPEKMNAFTGTMIREMTDAFDRIDADDDVRAVVVTGAGDRAFCAGADLTPEDGGGPFASEDPVEDYSDPRVRDGGGLLILRIYQCR
jgi:enoyl-CoA hydratase/carnithine racemase